jgi:hypothetical protein
MCDTPLCEMAKETYATSEVLSFCRFLHADRATIWLVILFLVLASSLRGQERVRTSSQGSSIEAYRRPPQTFFYLGPFQEELDGSFVVKYTDNVDLTKTDKISDLSFALGLGLDTTWVLTHLNQVEFSFAGQIINHFYGNGRNAINFAIAPNSKIEFKFEVSDLKFRLYDQFSYTQNPTTDPTATNTANLNSVSNTIGAAVDTDFNIAVLTLSADYSYNNQSGANSQDQASVGTTGSRQSFRAGPTLTFRFSPTILYGVNVEATRSSGDHSANVNSLNFGPFIKGKLSRDLEFDLAAGATLVKTNPPVSNGYYFSADVRYQITRYWQLLFSASHELIFTTGTGLVEQNLVRLGTELGLTRNTTISVSPFVNIGDVKSTLQNTSNIQGDYTQFGIEASLGWRPRKRWTASLTYDFIRLESGSGAAPGTTSGSYIQNTIALSLGYIF